jgi:hypothetical protein
MEQQMITILLTAAPELSGYLITMIGGFVAVVAFFVIASAMDKSKKVGLDRAEQLKAEALAFIANINATGRFPTIVTTVIMKAGEDGLLCEPSSLYESRRTRRIYGGASFRVAKGIYLHGGQSSSVQDFAEIDSGTITLTNKRLVFHGSMENRIIDLDKIVSVEVAGRDAFQVSTTKRMKDQTFTVRNPILWTVLVEHMIKNPSCVVPSTSTPPALPSNDGAPTLEQLQSWWKNLNGTDHCVLP